jgi:hypothetical protein
VLALASLSKAAVLRYFRHAASDQSRTARKDCREFYRYEQYVVPGDATALLAALADLLGLLQAGAAEVRRYYAAFVSGPDAEAVRELAQRVGSEVRLPALAVVLEALPLSLRAAGDGALLLEALRLRRQHLLLRVQLVQIGLERLDLRPLVAPLLLHHLLFRRDRLLLLAQLLNVLCEAKQQQWGPRSIGMERIEASSRAAGSTAANPRRAARTLVRLQLRLCDGRDPVDHSNLLGHVLRELLGDLLDLATQLIVLAADHAHVGLREQCSQRHALVTGEALGGARAASTTPYAAAKKAAS